MRFLRALLLIVFVAAAAAFVVAGRAAGPSIEVLQPTRAVGAAGVLELDVEAPDAEFSHIEAAIEQGDRRVSLLSLERLEEASLAQLSADRIRLTRAFTRQDLPEFRSGPARLIVSAGRPVLWGLRHRPTTVTVDLNVRFEPPRIAVLSMHHFVNHGGSEMVVYRVTPGDVESGVRVGELTYPGYPAAGAGIAGTDDTIKVAFFALLHDQDLNTPIELYARDDAGNTARGQFEYRVFRRPFRQTRIELDDRFIGRIVPAILHEVPELGTLPAGDSGSDELLPLFLRINGELREANARQIASFARQTMPQVLWEGRFEQLGGSQVESAFADYRTYYYRGREVDRQVHLGFDLAVTANVPITASNHGRVLFADYLGIYGNTVIIDHGMGVQSLYSHLSSFDVVAGDEVRKGQTIGRSGMTGLAGGDHLHFTMLVNGHPVTPIDWWSQQWIEDRIVRKIREASRQ